MIIPFQMVFPFSSLNIEWVSFLCRKTKNKTLVHNLYNDFGVFVYSKGFHIRFKDRMGFHVCYKIMNGLSIIYSFKSWTNPNPLDAS